MVGLACVGRFGILLVVMGFEYIVQTKTSFFSFVFVFLNNFINYFCLKKYIIAEKLF